MRVAWAFCSGDGVAEAQAEIDRLLSEQQLLQHREREQSMRAQEVRRCPFPLFARFFVLPVPWPTGRPWPTGQADRAGLGCVPLSA